MGIASAVKWRTGDFELLDIFDKVKDPSSSFPDWADVCYCPAEVVAALDEDLLISDEESSGAEGETVNKQSNCGSPDLNQNIDSPLYGTVVDELKRQRSRSGSEASFSDSSTSCSEEGELGAATAEVEELERQVARLEDSSELDEVSRGEHQALWIIIASRRYFLICECYIRLSVNWVIWMGKVGAPYPNFSGHKS